MSWSLRPPSRRTHRSRYRWTSRRLSSDKTVTLVLKDGTVVRQAVASAEAGQVTTAQGVLPARRPVEIATIQKINPPPVAWTGSIAANALYSQSNSTNIQFGGTTDANRRSETDRISFGAGYEYSRQGSTAFRPQAPTTGLRLVNMTTSSNPNCSSMATRAPNRIRSISSTCVSAKRGRRLSMDRAARFQCQSQRRSRMAVRRLLYIAGLKEFDWPQSLLSPRQIFRWGQDQSV